MQKYSLAKELTLSTLSACSVLGVPHTPYRVQAWLALYLESFRALLPVSWDDLALVSGWVFIF